MRPGKTSWWTVLPGQARSSAIPELTTSAITITIVAPASRTRISSRSTFFAHFWWAELSIKMRHKKITNLPCTDHQPVRGRHHGQLWLPDPRLVHLGSAPLGRVHSSVEWVRPRRQGANQAPRRSHAAEENLAAARLRQTLPAQSGLQGQNTN